MVSSPHLDFHTFSSLLSFSSFLQLYLLQISFFLLLLTTFFSIVFVLMHCSMVCLLVLPEVCLLHIPYFLLSLNSPTIPTILLCWGFFYKCKKLCKLPLCISSSCGLKLFSTQLFKIKIGFPFEKQNSQKSFSVYTSCFLLTSKPFCALFILKRLFAVG